MIKKILCKYYFRKRATYQSIRLGHYKLVKRKESEEVDAILYHQILNYMINSNQQLNDYNNSIPGRRVLESNNSILVIRVYYQNGLWVFDDDRVGLTAEPFVGGADDFIDYILGKMGNYEDARRNGFSAVFSNQEFMGAMARLDFDRFDYSGSIYHPNGFVDFINKFGTSDVWLCPALNLYYQDSPERIYMSVKV